jgi:hypothetical protein
MTISQQHHRAGSPVWRVLRRSAGALRELHDGQVYAWECFFRPAGAPPPHPQAPAPAPPKRMRDRVAVSDTATRSDARQVS